MVGFQSFNDFLSMRQNETNKKEYVNFTVKSGIENEKLRIGDTFLESINT